MPRKTKKQKKLSDYRRQLIPVNPIAFTHEKEPEKPKAANSSLEENIFSQTTEEKEMTILTIKDLKKTILLSLILFALEISIFYAMLLR